MLIEPIPNSALTLTVALLSAHQNHSWQKTKKQPTGAVLTISFRDLATREDIGALSLRTASSSSHPKPGTQLQRWQVWQGRWKSLRGKAGCRVLNTCSLNTYYVLGHVPGLGRECWARQPQLPFMSFQVSRAGLHAPKVGGTAECCQMVSENLITQRDSQFLSGSGSPSVLWLSEGGNLNVVLEQRPSYLTLVRFPLQPAQSGLQAHSWALPGENRASLPHFHSVHLHSYLSSRQERNIFPFSRSMQRSFKDSSHMVSRFKEKYEVTG